MSILCVDPAEEARRETESALVAAGFDTTACGSLDEGAPDADR